MAFGNNPVVLGATSTAYSVSGGTGLFGDGSATAPSISFLSDPDTGLYRFGADSIGITLGGALQLKFNQTAAIVGPSVDNFVQLTGAGAINITGAGTNQNITLTPSGTGTVVVAKLGTVSATSLVLVTTGITALTLDSSQNATFAATIRESVDTKSGAGAISLTASTTKLTTTSADALTLADGANGQVKRIIMIADGGDGTLTPTTKTGYATITFNDVGDSVTLQFVTTQGWMILNNYGCTIA